MENVMGFHAVNLVYALCKVSSYVVCSCPRVNDGVDCCRFLTMLEEEVFGANSPIWDVEFTQHHASASNGAGE